jgi:8-oxo-dGTP pyrophosphatase MutT (NUDIX family)
MREIRPLAIILLNCPGADGEPRYVLQLNPHLDGYGFFGGRIEEQESSEPNTAALRELREETGEQELNKRWGVSLPDDVPDREWRALAESLTALPGPRDGAFVLPFFSRRARQEAKPPERVAHLYFYTLEIHPDLYPRLRRRLARLADALVEWGDERKPLCRFFSVRELCEEASRNPTNAFLPFVLKQGLIPSFNQDAPSQAFELDLPRLETWLEQRLQKLLAHVLALDRGEALSLSLLPPGDDDIDLARADNRTLTARLELRWSGSEEVCELDFPYPYHGVFVLQSDDAWEAELWTWHPRLAPRPGLWRVREYQASGDPVTELIVALPDAWKEQLPLGKPLTKKQSEKLLQQRRSKARLMLLPPLLTDDADGWNQLPEEYHKRLFLFGKDDIQKFWEAVKRLAESPADPPAETVDSQDLACQRLKTYAVHLGERLLRRWLRELLIETRAVTAAQLRGDVATPSAEVWKELCRQPADCSVIDVIGLKKQGWLHRFEPVNSIAAAAQLTALQRYPLPSNSLEKLPALWRQNHPSFQGWICPVESPETTKVGLTLHLARGVGTDVLGRLVKMAASDGLGYGASLVPFYQYNDAARAMMGAKNLKQALPLINAERPLVITAGEQAIVELTTPLRRLIPALSEETGAMPGVNLLVAYLPWYGWNFEDAIVGHQRLSELMAWTEEKQYAVYLQPGFVLCPPAPAGALQQALQAAFYSGEGVRTPGPLAPGDPVAYFRSAEGEVLPVRCGGDVPGELLAVRYHEPPSPLFGGRLEWTVRYREPLGVGDKLMGRYGNKGVIARLLPSEQLPRLPDDPRLPRALRGRAVDLVLNPHGVISRMNLGQLIETHVGLARTLAPQAVDEAVGKAFEDFESEPVRDCFKRCKAERDQLIDPEGRMTLTLPDGSKTQAPVVVGFQYFVRLNHIPGHKAHIRTGREPDARYDSVTGQPVGGRRQGGGQRLGEMEIWALAAHRAEKNLAGILGGKSDPSQSTGQQTWDAIREHLYALGLEFIEPRENEPPASHRLQWSSPSPEPAQFITVARTWKKESGLQGSFHCPKAGCGYSYPDQAVVVANRAQRGKWYLSLEDLLASKGYRLDNDDLQDSLPVPTQHDASSWKQVLRLQPQSEETLPLQLGVTLTRKKRSISAVFELGDEAIVGYTQVDGDYALSKLPGLTLACKTHVTTRLECSPRSIKPMPVPGGLCDPELTGNDSLEQPETRRAFVQLPFEVKPRIKKQLLPQAVSCLPVLPLKYRRSRFSQYGGRLWSIDDPLTYRYQQLLDRIAAYNKPLAKFANCQEPEDQELKNEKAELIEDRVNAIYKYLWDRVAGKHGLLRRHGLGRRVNGSGRLVIVPDPTLAWDECGVPSVMLAALLGDRLERWDQLNQTVQSLAAEDLGLTQRLGEPKFWTTLDWQRRRTQQEQRLIQEVTAAYLAQADPPIHILLNRAPSLHKYNIMACRPVLFDPADGLVLRINPLVCKGFAADFDGDTMAIHMPASDEEHKEAAQLRPTDPRNLLSVANSAPVADFDQDFVLGHFLALQDEKLKAELATLFPDCAECRERLQPDRGIALLKHLCQKHPDEAATVMPQWLRLACRVATEQGISFGFLELLADRPNVSALVGPPQPDLGTINETLNGETLKHLREWIKFPPTEPRRGFAAIAVSGARGDKQVRQLIAARGFLAPGEKAFEMEPERFLFNQPLVCGMTEDEAFLAAMNARSSMVDKKLLTGKAGFLTRALVLACWPWYVIEADCGAPVHDLNHCWWMKEGKGVCAVCYGPVPGYGDKAPIGYPAGLIAAQSFGERGTQLSMQSFHTGERVLSLSEMQQLLSGCDPQRASRNWFKTESQAAQFVQRIQSITPYARLDRRHLALIWQVIHASGAGSLFNATAHTVFMALAGGHQWRALCDLTAEMSLRDQPPLPKPQRREESESDDTDTESCTAPSPGTEGGGDAGANSLETDKDSATVLEKPRFSPVDQVFLGEPPVYPGKNHDHDP